MISRWEGKRKGFFEDRKRRDMDIEERMNGKKRMGRRGNVIERKDREKQR